MALKPTYTVPDLPLKREIETSNVLRAAARAHRRLAELKGRATTIPNPGILIDTLSLQEAKASSEIENIITTQSDLFQTSLFPENPTSPAAKEVALYRDALHLGFTKLRDTEGILSNNTLIEMFQILKGTDERFRATSGTALRNEVSGKTVYVPPQDPSTVQQHMTALEKYMNSNECCDFDPLVKMAIIHHQFESIHPFSDGNGRIGRILNVLYITKEGLLDIPVLYLSRYITGNKGRYYNLLQYVRENDDWEDWVLFMLDAVEKTSIETLILVESIKNLMMSYKNQIRSNHKKIYSQDLLNTIFRFPYTKIDLVHKEIGKTRQTAAKYLDELCEAKMLSKHRYGNSNFYINDRLASLFIDSQPPAQLGNSRHAGVSVDLKS